MAKRGVAKPPGRLVVPPDCQALKDLLLWMRRERIAASQVTVGNVTIAGIFDRRAAGDDERKPMDAARSEVRSSIIEQYAGPLMAGMASEPDAETSDEIEPTVEDDD